MVPTYWYSTFAAVITSGFVLAAAVLMSAEPVLAAEAASIDRPLSAAPPGITVRPSDEAVPGIPSAPMRHRLDAGDERATLEALQLTLTEVEDGSTFVWHRRNGRVSGLFQPTRSFKGDTGQVCRRFRMMLTSGRYSRRLEAIACRDDTGVWTIAG